MTTKRQIYVYLNYSDSHHLLDVSTTDEYFEQMELSTLGCHKNPRGYFIPKLTYLAVLQSLKAGGDEVVEKQYTSRDLFQETFSQCEYILTQGPNKGKKCPDYVASKDSDVKYCNNHSKLDEKIDLCRWVIQNGKTSSNQCGDVSSVDNVYCATHWEFATHALFSLGITKEAWKTCVRSAIRLHNFNTSIEKPIYNEKTRDPGSVCMKCEKYCHDACKVITPPSSPREKKCPPAPKKKTRWCNSKCPRHCRVVFTHKRRECNGLCPHCD